ncbi:MAG TPA: hypothetical protein PLH57_04135 [Oligoflexia bacterium]|nr:hypothetical protein [Oligoflexia bacterium]
MRILRQWRLLGPGVLFQLFVAGLLWTTSGICGPVVVHITFNDEKAFTQGHAQFIKRIYEITLPEARYLEWSVDVPQIGRLSEYKYRNEIIDQMKRDLKLNDQITNLVISTHGNTIKRDGHRFTRLDLIGEIGPNGLDPKALNFFAPLVGRFSKNAHIFLNSCDTFRGPIAEVKVRAEAFMRALRIDSGKIYGAEIADDPFPLPNHRPVHSLMNYDRPNIEFELNNSLVWYQGLVAMSAPSLGRRMYTASRMWFKKSIQKRTGFLISMKNGRADQVQGVHELRDADLVFGIPESSTNDCIKYLKEVAGVATDH